MQLMLLLLLLLEVDDARGNACLRSLTTSTGAQLLLNEPNSSPTLTHALMTLRRDSIANQPPCDCTEQGNRRNQTPAPFRCRPRRVIFSLRILTCVTFAGRLWTDATPSARPEVSVRSILRDAARRGGPITNARPRMRKMQSVVREICMLYNCINELIPRYTVV